MRQEEGPVKGKPETLVPIVRQSPQAPPAGLIGVVDTSHGNAVVDRRGFVLYTFKDDKVSKDGKAISSACLDACARIWPPVVVESGMPIALPGINPRALGILTRPDGGKQITLNGRPLYQYTGDSRPAQPTGDGVDGLWKIAEPG